MENTAVLIIPSLFLTFIIAAIIAILSELFNKELRNLIKINRLGERVNSLLYRKQELEKILLEFHNIETREHADKKALYVMMISDLLNSKKI